MIAKGYAVIIYSLQPAVVGLNILHHIFIQFCDWDPSKNGDIIIADNRTATQL